MEAEIATVSSASTVSNDEIPSPRAPDTVEDTGLDTGFLADLTLKMAYLDVQCTTARISQRLCLPLALCDIILQALRKEHLVELTSQISARNHKYTVLDKGVDRVKRLFEVSGYVGPAPVSLSAYTSTMNRQCKNPGKVTEERVREVFESLVLPDSYLITLGLVASSGRSVFLTGPPGNGKTSIAQLLHELNVGEIWIPYAIEIDGQVIRLYDIHNHQVVEDEDLPAWVDRRWVHIRRPIVIVGGELTIDQMDLTYSSNLRFYEAPFQLKANGGTLLIDDFGRQRVDPNDFVNRWIVPLENGVDYLTLATGKKIDVPFKQLLVFATNLKLQNIVDQAFVRRLGYRLEVETPSESAYRSIFERYAAKHQISVQTEDLDRLIARYKTEGRPLRGSEPRDLIERVVDIKKYMPDDKRSLSDLLTLAWLNYFGASSATHNVRE